MKHSIRLLAAAVLGSALVAVPLGTASAIITGTYSQASPSGTLLVSWPVKGAVLTFFNAETKQVTGTYNTGLAIDQIHFSLSERYLCISSGLRVIVIDRGNANQKVINLPAPANSGIFCAASPAGFDANPNDQFAKSAADTVANRTIVITVSTSKTVACGSGTAAATDYTTKYYDPKTPAGPYRQYAKRDSSCNP